MSKSGAGHPSTGAGFVLQNGNFLVNKIMKLLKNSLLTGAGMSGALSCGQAGHWSGLVIGAMSADRCVALFVLLLA